MCEYTEKCDAFKINGCIGTIHFCGKAGWEFGGEKMKICDRCLVKGCSEQRRFMCIISEFGIEMEENANDNEARIIKAVLFALKDKVRACYEYGQER